MFSLPRSTLKRRRRPFRRAARFLTGFGISSEAVAVVGMIFGILAGASFMGTREPFNPPLFWSLALLFCLIRLTCLRIDSYFGQTHSRHSIEEIYVTELPERVSDAVIIIGFGFAAQSNPWLALLTALAAIFSSYLRSIGYSRGAGKRISASGPMNRVHRLVLLSVTSALMLLPIAGLNSKASIPQIALWLMFFGCLVTILLRWLNLQKFMDR